MQDVKYDALMVLADSCVEQAQHLFMRDGFLSSVAIAVRPDSIKPVCFDVDVTSEDKAVAIKELADEGCSAVIFIVDAVIADTEDASIKRMEDAPEDSKSNALLTLVYTKEGTTVRRMLYVMNKEVNRPNFIDKGWEKGFKIDSRSAFANPYVRSTTHGNPWACT